MHTILPRRLFVMHVSAGAFFWAQEGLFRYEIYYLPFLQKR